MKTKLLMIVFIAVLSAINAQNVPAYVPKTGLVGWWPFNGNANDGSGNGNHGTVNGATLTSDRNGLANSAYSFNGGNDRIVVKNSLLSSQPTSYSVSIWFLSNLNSVSGELICDRSTINFDYKYRLFIDTDSLIYATVSGVKVGGIKAFYSKNKWNHVVIIGDLQSNTSKFYLNGLLIHTSNIFYPNNLNATTIGANYAPVNPDAAINGKIDDIAIYNRALSDFEIKALYTGEVTSAIPSYVPKTGLVGWWPFNGNANDESGNGNHGVVNGASLTADRNSKANSAYNFNGTNNIIEISNSNSLQNISSISISTWINIKNWFTNPVWNNQSFPILCKGKTSTNFGKYSMAIIPNQYIANLNQKGGYSSSLNTNLNVWINVIAIVTSVDTKFYINGVLSSTVQSTSTPGGIGNYILTDPLIIGADYPGQLEYANGMIDDIAIYNRALTQEEITNLYRGTSCTTPLATITPKGATTFLSGGSTELTATTGANYTYEWYLNNVLISGATTSNFKATASGSYTVKVMDGTCSATSAPVVIKVVPKLSDGVITVVAPPTVKQNGLVEVVLSTSTLDSLHKVIAYQTDFSYDSTRFSFVSSSLVGSLNPSGTVQVNSSVKGKLNVGYMSPKIVVGTGTLVKLTFKASLVMGSTPFGLSNFLYNATPITKLVGDTISIIDGIPPTGKITYSVNPARKGDSLIITVAFNEKMAISPIPQLELTGQNIKPKTNMTRINETTYQLIHVVEKGSGIVNVRLYTGTDLEKNSVTALPTSGATFSVIPPVYGDIDTNKMIQAYDAAIALQYSVGLNAISHIDPSPWSNWRVVGANVDTVAGVTANDASLILQKSVGQLSSFPADGLKRSVQEMGDVEIIQVKDQLLFKAKGNLQGFNFNVKDIQGVLGSPEFVNTEMMVAENRNGSDYKIGIANAGKFKEGEIFMKINLKTDAPVKLLATINVNTRKVERLIDGNIVSKTKYVNVKDINVYPNPAKNSVTISGAEGYDLTIFNIEGRKVYSSLLDTDYFQAQFKDSLPTGLYIIKLSSEQEKSSNEYKLVVE